MYRKEVVRYILSKIKVNKPSKITILQDLRMIDKTWKNVQEQTIRTCFIKSEFTIENSTEKNFPGNEKEMFHEDWAIGNKFLNTSTSFDEYVNLDENVATSGLLTNELCSQPLKLRKKTTQIRTKRKKIIAKLLLPLKQNTH